MLFELIALIIVAVVAGLLLYPHYWLERRSMSPEARARANEADRRIR